MNAQAQSQQLTANKDSICPYGAVTFTVTANDSMFQQSNDSMAYCNWFITSPNYQDTFLINDSLHANHHPGFDTIIFTLTFHVNSLPGNWHINVDVHGMTFQNQSYKQIYVSDPSLYAFASVQPTTCGHADGSITIYADSSHSAYSYAWSNGSSTKTATGLANGTYSVLVTNHIGCTASYTGITVTTSSVVPTNSICMVTVDSLSQHNIIIWNKTSAAPLDSFIIYREIGTNNYQPIGAVPYNALSLFVDTVRHKYFPNTGDPNMGTYRYKIMARDSCGKYSSYSPYHNTIFMLNNSGAFSWLQLYTIEGSANPVISYILMRDDNSNGNWHAVNSVSGNQQTIIDPAYSTYQNTASWKITTQWNITCTPTIMKNPVAETFISSQSNVYKVAGAGVNEINNSINVSVSPNPSNGNFTLSSEISKGEIEIYNIIGEKTYSTTVNNKSSAFNLNMPSGIYFLQLKTGQGTAIKKIIINK